MFELISSHSRYTFALLIVRTTPKYKMKRTSFKIQCRGGNPRQVVLIWHTCGYYRQVVSRLHKYGYHRQVVFSRWLTMDHFLRILWRWWKNHCCREFASQINPRRRRRLNVGSQSFWLEFEGGRWVCKMGIWSKADWWIGLFELIQLWRETGRWLDFGWFLLWKQAKVSGRWPWCSWNQPAYILFPRVTKYRCCPLKASLRVRRWACIARFLSRVAFHTWRFKQEHFLLPLCAFRYPILCFPIQLAPPCTGAGRSSQVLDHDQTWVHDFTVSFWDPIVYHIW